MNIKIFTFNQFFENTFIISDSTNECIIIDPGCYDKNEKVTKDGQCESCSDNEKPS